MEHALEGVVEPCSLPFFLLMPGLSWKWSCSTMFPHFYHPAEAIVSRSLQQWVHSAMDLNSQNNGLNTTFLAKFVHFKHHDTMWKAFTCSGISK